MSESIGDRIMAWVLFVLASAGQLLGYSWTEIKGVFELVGIVDADGLPDAHPRERIGHAGQTQTVITVVSIAVAAFIGLVIVGTVYNLMPATGVGEVNNTTDDILTDFTDAIAFVGIIMLVLFASIVIAVVQRF